MVCTEITIFLGYICAPPPREQIHCDPVPETGVNWPGCLAPRETPVLFQ